MITWEDRVVEPLESAEDASRYYDFVDKNGIIINEDVKLILKNSVLHNGTPVNADNLNKITPKEWNISLPSTAWVLESGRYTQQVSISDIKDIDLPNAYINLSENDTVAKNENKAWAMIKDVFTFDGYVKFICWENKTPDILINVILRRT